MNRRQWISACATVAGAFGFLNATDAQTPPPPAPTGPFTLPPLGYEYDALEPFIDSETMHLHHDKHHKAYVDNLNKAVANFPDLQKMSVDELQTKLASLPDAVRTAVRNQGGGNANHTLLWKTLSKTGGQKPKGELAADIDKTFGSFTAFQEKLSTTSIGTFGSGFGWLVLDKGALSVVSLPNQDSPLASGAQPLFGIDVWEHAYYLKYQNRRPDYVKAIWNVLNWDFISDRYATLKKA